MSSVGKASCTARVGATVGVAVGGAVGALDGVAVGTWDGATDGVLVGVLEGVVVGGRLGWLTRQLYAFGGLLRRCLRFRRGIRWAGRGFYRG